ncbi:MAG: MFS transporter [Pseudomonadota bacterium]
MLKNEWRLLTFGFLMTLFSSPGQTFFIAYFSADLRQQLSLSHAEFSAVYSAATLLSAVAVVWTGSLIDRIDLKVFSQITVFGLAAGCATLALGGNIVTLLFAFFLLRQFGQGLMMMAASATMVRYIADARGTANALSGMGYRTGEAFLPAIIVAAMLMFNWQTVLLSVAAVLILFLAPAISFLLRDHAVRHEQYVEQLTAIDSPSESMNWTRKEVLKDLRFYLLLPAVSSGALLFTGFIFHQIALVEYKQWSLQAWGSWFVVYGITSMFAALACGRLIDLFGAERIVPWLPLPLALALFSLAHFSAPWSAGLFLVLMSISNGMLGTALSPFYAELYGTANIGSIKAATSAIMVFASALSPVVLGICLDREISFDLLALYGGWYTVICVLLAFCALYIPAVRRESVAKT